MIHSRRKPSSGGTFFSAVNLPLFEPAATSVQLAEDEVSQVVEYSPTAAQRLRFCQKSLHRRGVVHDRTFDDQRLRAGGLKSRRCGHRVLEYGVLEQAVATLRADGSEIPDELLQHLSPLAWEHIVLTGEYRWTSDVARAVQVNDANCARALTLPRRWPAANLRSYRTFFPK